MGRGPDESVRLLARIAEEWTARLTRYAASILRDEELARDAVQDVLLRLCEPSSFPASAGDGLAGQSLCDEPAARAWLFKAVRNRCIDLLRKEGRMSHLEDHYGQDGAIPRMRLVGGGGNGDEIRDDPARAAETRESADAALAALEGLPALQREALRLKFSGELSYKQIAETMGKSVTHVGVLIHEGLKSLRERLGVREKASA
jgi:RNA polymerase sigma-70 factor (ECF subfamily)